MNKLLRFLMVAALAVVVAACGSVAVDDVLPDKSVEYKRERQAERNLAIPPDLTSERINDRMSVPDTSVDVAASYSEYLTDRKLRGVDDSPRRAVDGDVLPEIRDIEVRRDGDARWLLIGATVDEVWQRVIDFWQDNGILMAEQDPTVGVMRTSWLENRAEISRDIITSTIRKAFDGLYETGTRDQYRVRLERTRDDRTELFLTHFGMEEQVIADTTGGVESTVWVPRPRDPGLEVEMLRQMMVFMGASDERARTRLAARGTAGPTRSQLLKTGEGTELQLVDDFDRAWRLVGLALDRVGFAVEDRDRNLGIYYVRYNDPSKQDADKGWVSKLAFWSADKDVDKINRYQVRVGTRGGQTVVHVFNDQEKRDNSPTAVRILTLLDEQLR